MIAMDVIRWLLVVSPLLLTQGSAQALPQPLVFPALVQPLPHLQSLAPEVAPGASQAPSEFMTQVRARCPHGLMEPAALLLR